MKKTAFAICFAALAIAAVSCKNTPSATEQAAPAEAVAEVVPKVSVESVTMRDVPQEGVYTSTVEANVINNIAPQSSLRIKTLKADIGDFVYAGKVVAEMDVASLEQTKLQLINDSTELVRIKSLYEVGGVSKSDLDAITVAYNVRRTAYENLLENTVLRSPITGVITARNYDKGDMYSMGKPIFTVEQITPVKLLVAISEKDYTKINKGDSVNLTVDAFPDLTFTGKIARIYPTMDAATHTFQVEVQVANNYKTLRPGMYARVTVGFGKNHSVVAPDRAVVKQQGSGDKFMYVLQDDGTVKMTKVTLGVRLGNEYEVLEGLNDGDKVVVEGLLRIKDGVKVEFTEE
ncbi:MAG: efflux RND transporter periplasmic adaptor subunit [Bacteroidales bacterium]|nr:efflux RND transporter periplasmic adaptor subunit [Bacteroidales bacterium]